jgi:D-xylose transport system permease protein
LLLVLVSAGLARSVVVDRRHRRQYGFPLEDGLTAFLKLFVAIQALSLLVIVMNLHKGVPLSLVILGGVAWVVQVITRHTRFGRYLYAIGGNEEAARLSGIPVEKVIVGAFVLLGAITALTGFMQTAYGGYSTTTVGKLMELDAIAACVIGGTSLKGGRGTVLGVLFGALIMATLLNGMTLLAVTPEMKLIARGLVLVLAVWLDVVLARRQQARG